MVFTAGCSVMSPQAPVLSLMPTASRGGSAASKVEAPGEESRGAWRPVGRGAQAGPALAPCSDSAGMPLSRLPEGRDRSREACLQRKDHRGPREK